LKKNQIGEKGSRQQKKKSRRLQAAKKKKARAGPFGIKREEKERRPQELMTERPVRGESR